MVLPSYVDCESDKIIVCDYYITKDCQETCAYAKDIMALGIGAITYDPTKIRLEDHVSDVHGNMKWFNGELNPTYQEK